MKINVGRVLAPAAVVALVLVLYGIKLENRFAGALDRDDEISRRAWVAKRENLTRAVTALERRAHVADSLARIRSTVSVSFASPTCIVEHYADSIRSVLKVPPVQGAQSRVLQILSRATNARVPQNTSAQCRAAIEGQRAQLRGYLQAAGTADTSAVRVLREPEGGDGPRRLLEALGRPMALPAVPPETPPTGQLATVTINDTAYAVPVRVGVEVARMTQELANADSLRKTAVTVVGAVREAVPAADSAIATASRKPGWLRRLFSKSVTVLCAAGGAGVGAAVGTIAGGGGAIPGAIIGAGGGVGICEVAR